MKLIVKYYDVVSDLQQTITNAGNSFVGIVKGGAVAISALISVVAGLMLLVLCVKTMWKSSHGNSDAVADAMQMLATVGAVLCFSTAIMAIFF